MTIHTQHHFLRCESGAAIVEWTTLVGAIVGFGIAAVAAVQTGVVSLGGRSGDSLAPTTTSYTQTVASGGPDVQMNTGGNAIYTPLATRKDEYEMYMYELSGKPAAELSALYLQYIEGAAKHLDAGDLDSARKYLDVAGAVASVMKDSRIPLPDSDYKLNQFYGHLQKK